MKRAPASARTATPGGGARGADAAPSAAAAGPARAWPAALLVGLAVLAAALLYLPALHTSFFADDYLFLDQVRQKSLIAALRTPDPLSNFYRPISRQLYFWTVAGASNESAFVFHCVGLAWFLALLVLMFGVARKLAGTYAATFATALVALHYTGDVPIRWACGSQELLSVSGALAALWLHLSGRRVPAACAMAFAALSKEVVLLTPLIAAIADRRAGESFVQSLRRAWPLGIGVGVWAAVWLLAPHTRQAASTEIELSPWSPLATYVHLVQIVLGAEARRNELWRLPTVGPPWIPLALAAVALWLAGSAARWRGLGVGSRADAAGAAADAREAPRRDPAPREIARARRHAIVTGVAWALLATLPVVAVGVLWSAYYYLFAMCGVAIALGALLASLPRGWALAALGVLAWGSNSSRHLDEFATPRSPWTEMSHINKFYLERATRYVERYLEDLRRMKPTLPRNSTLFWAGLKGNIAFQVADGPLMRWAYRDPTVRSYYLNDFTLAKAKRGPSYFFVGARDSIREMEGGPDLYDRIAFSMLINEWPPGARDALTLQLEQHPEDGQARYWLAWCHLALGENATAHELLRTAGYVPDAAPAPESAEARARAQRGDVAGATGVMQGAVRAHALDPAAHALLADLLLIADAENPQAAVEAFAARTLAPTDAIAWRRWAAVQMHRRRYLEAMKSFERYFKLAGVAGAGDTEAKGWVEEIRRSLPGGDIAPEGLRD